LSWPFAGRSGRLGRDPARQRPEAGLVEATTRCRVRVAANSLVDAISHPLNLMAEAMADHGVLFDLINEM
jgi:hypothetical protein